MYDIELKQDAQRKDIEEIKKQQDSNIDVIASNETVAKVSHDKAASNEQYLRNFNVRIFNLPEDDKESIEECEEKVLKLFKEKLKVEVPLEAIDVIHRVGKKKQKTKKPTNGQNTAGPSGANNNLDSNENMTTDETNVAGDKDQTKNSNDRDSQTQNQENESQATVEMEPENERPVIVSFLSRRLRRENSSQQILSQK